MRASVLVVAALPIAGLLTLPASTTIAADNQHRSHSSRHHPTSKAAPPGPIACTEGGCQRIPAACTPVPGRTWSGLPTGYDVIVCPQGVSPLR